MTPEPEGLMLLGYNTNGLTGIRLEDALRLLADLGYQSVAITLDYKALDPFDRTTWQSQAGRIRNCLDRLGLRCVVETGSRFLLDPAHKHRPTLLDAEAEQRKRRWCLLERAIRLAAILRADAVSFWSGVADSEEPEEVLYSRLVSACQELCEAAERHNVRLAFEPEPGMWVDTMPRFERLWRAVGHPNFGLTLDIGHLVCQGESISDTIRRWRDVLWNVHLEDMRYGVHEHLPFGEGEVPVPQVLQLLAEVGYRGGVHVELSRHSHEGLTMARRARDYLRQHWPRSGL
jgi:L-ribulose-5-phosphate 3-epimerase